MKIMSYNISWCKQEKIDWLVGHQDVDAFVVPECGNRENIVVPNGFRFFWMGEYATKGLGVLVGDGHKCELANWYNKDLRYALPIIIDDKYLLLAIWPTKKEKTDSYIDICLSILKAYEESISRYPTIIIGDYNIISNRKDSKPIFQWMEEHNLKSAHHTYCKEEIGKEQRPTYYHQYKETAPFFIDYAFTNVEVKDYKLYTWDESKRLSDHVPLMVEI